MEFDQLSTLWFFKPLFCRVSNSVGKKQLNAMQMWKLDSFVSLKQCSGGDLTQIFFLWHKTGFSPPPGREMTLSCVCRYPFLHYFAKTQTFSQIPPSVCCKIIRKSFGIVFMCTGMWIRFFFFLLNSSKKRPKAPLWCIYAIYAIYAIYRSPEIDVSIDIYLSLSIR